MSNLSPVVGTQVGASPRAIAPPAIALPAHSISRVRSSSGGALYRVSEPAFGGQVFGARSSTG
jgi:hypothetical protein